MGGSLCFKLFLCVFQQVKRMGGEHISGYAPSQVVPILRKPGYREKWTTKLNFYHEGHEDHEEIPIKQALMVFSCLGFILRVLRDLRGSSFKILLFCLRGLKVQKVRRVNQITGAKFIAVRNHAGPNT
jgi:hypothetical protein